jgi:hypothetical protein
VVGKGGRENVRPCGTNPEGPSKPPGIHTTYVSMYGWQNGKKNTAKFQMVLKLFS